MIKFELYISPNFRGGQYFTSFQVSSHKELLSSLKNYWYKTGFHSSTGEIFVFTELEINNTKKSVECGYYVFDEDGAFLPLSSKDSDYEVEQYWEKLGINFDNTSDEDLFEIKTKLLLEPNGPTRLLGTWIDAMWDASYDFEIDAYYEENGIESQGYGKPALAHILDFAKSQNKSFEMFEWLATTEAATFLENDRYLPLGNELLVATKQLVRDSLKSTSNKEELLNFLDAYVEENQIPLSQNLRLN